MKSPRREQRIPRIAPQKTSRIKCIPVKTLETIRKIPRTKSIPDKKGAAGKQRVAIANIKNECREGKESPFLFFGKSL